MARPLGAGFKLNQPKADLLSDLRKHINAGITGPPLFPAPAVKCKFVPKAAEQHPQESEGADEEDGERDVAPTYDFGSCFSPKFKIMHFQNRDIKLYTVVLLFLCFLNFLLKLCCR